MAFGQSEQLDDVAEDDLLLDQLGDGVWCADDDVDADVGLVEPGVEGVLDAGDDVGDFEFELGVVETTVPENSQLVGKSVAETSWPAGCVPAAVVRASQILPASTETHLSPGDKLICLTDVAQAEALHHLVAHPANDD